MLQLGCPINRLGWGIWQPQSCQVAAIWGNRLWTASIAGEAAPCCTNDDQKKRKTAANTSSQLISQILVDWVKKALHCCEYSVFIIFILQPPALQLEPKGKGSSRNKRSKFPLGSSLYRGWGRLACKTVVETLREVSNPPCNVLALHKFKTSLEKMIFKKNRKNLGIKINVCMCGCIHIHPPTYRAFTTKQCWFEHDRKTRLGIKRNGEVASRIRCSLGPGWLRWLQSHAAKSLWIAGASEPPAGLSSKLKQVYPTVSPALHFLKPEFHHQQMVEIEFSLRFPGASATIKFHQMPTKSAPGRLVYGRTDTWKTKALTNHPITSYHILSPNETFWTWYHVIVYASRAKPQIRESSPILGGHRKSNT